jgi:probable F420-dependent oxidoreductase
VKIDLSLIGDTSASAGPAASRAEASGFDGVWATESVTDAFLQSLSAIDRTQRIQVGTAIAVAFSRNPMTTAYAAWDLAASSEGRFVLGLGSQVKAHVERRFSMPWSSPLPRMRDYIGALRAIWEAWRTGDRLDYRGEHYQHTLMSPVFSPPNHDHDIPIAVAAVGPKMTELAGELCDGVILHGMTNPSYLDEVSLPALEAGLERSGRDRADVFVSCPVFMVMGDDEEELASARAASRNQLAFYASTPAYRPVLDCVGYGELQPELRELSAQGRWEEMGRLVDDDLLDLMTLQGHPEDMPGLARERFGDRLDRTSSYFGWPIDDPDRLADILRGFRGGNGT